MPNQINLIKPYKWNGQWVFDDATVGLNKEPFVAGADTLIDVALARKGFPHTKAFAAFFSKDPFPGAEITLRWVRDEMGGNVYNWEGREGWLCPALLKYFAVAPKEIHVQMKPLT